MTIFEFLSVSVAIVLAAAMGRLISATTSVFDPARRDWLHAGYCLVSFLAILLTWWLQWQLSDIGRWHFIDFLLFMGSPIAIYLAVHVLVTEEPSSISDWSTHFADVHRWFFSALLAQAVLATIRQLIVQQDGFLMVNGLLPIVIMSVFTAGVISSRRIVHIGILVAWLLIITFVISRQPLILV